MEFKRIEACHKHRNGEVGIRRHRESLLAHYTGLMVCGSVWVCPVCSAKISEKRRVELQGALVSAKSMGLVPYLSSLTAPHSKADPLWKILARISHARKLMMHRKPFKAWAKKVGLVGSVRALEVTHGENGWHVHFHDILFCRGGCVAPDACEVLPFWQDACKTAHLDRPNEHGVDTRAGDDEVGNYIAKWGMENELTKGMSKQGRDGNRSPFDFLRDFVLTGEESHAVLFREYALEFKGKRQLVWSEGLRDLLGLGAEKTDVELAEEKVENSRFLCSLTLAQWRAIYKHAKQGEVLEIASEGEDSEAIAAVYEFISGLMESTEGRIEAEKAMANTLRMIWNGDA